MNGTSSKTILEQSSTMPQAEGRKSLFWAYFYWIIGGFWGAHHFYLERDDHGLIYICTLGGYGFGWLRDLWRLPEYVADANDQPDFVNRFKYMVRTHRKPPFLTVRFTAAVTLSWQFGELLLAGIPQDEIYGINFKPLIILVPVAVAYGTWLVGNVGREKGSIWLALLASYFCYPTVYYFGDDSVWITCMSIVSGLVFDTWSKQWRLKKKPRSSKLRRLTFICVFLFIHYALLGSYLYMNATFTDQDGEEIKLSEAVKHLFTSPIWLDLKASLETTWKQAKHKGFWATWHQIIELSDPRGEMNAYMVLGLSKTASQSEIISRWRELLRENHPDKVKGSEEERRKAQERFLQIQEAYDILSATKNRRRKKNKIAEPL